MVIFFYIISPTSFAILIDGFNEQVKSIGSFDDVKKAKFSEYKAFLSWKTLINPTKILQQDLEKLKKKEQFDAINA